MSNISEFKQRLETETSLLHHWFDHQRFTAIKTESHCHFQAWMLTSNFLPHLAQSTNALKRSSFLLEIPSFPHKLGRDFLSNLEEDLLQKWRQNESLAEAQGLRALMIGSLPTLTPEHLSNETFFPTLENWQKRLHVLNQGIPIALSIKGKENLFFEHKNVLTEFVGPGLQINWPISQNQGPKKYNASIIASCFVAAAGSNSPYFFGKELWDETRIALVEQSVNIKTMRLPSLGQHTRAGLGQGYVQDSLMELFLENLSIYPILSASSHQSAPENQQYLQEQNSSIWRWNRPWLDFGTHPSLALEFRIPSAGPTVIDTMANLALQIGLVEALSEIKDLNEKIPFPVARENFYNASRLGLDAKILWADGKTHCLRTLLLHQLLPQVSRALNKLQFHPEHIHRLITTVLRPRIETKRTGSFWQKEFVSKHGPQFPLMLEGYYRYQRENLPVHLWEN